jgi:hypothetical protein
MSEQWLVEALSAGDLSFPPEFPRDIAAAAQMRHPLDFVGLSGLTVASVRDWLTQRGLPDELRYRDRRLHGCMVAVAGTAALFFDSDDSEGQQRFTLAHEVAHFVLDHLMPREEALRCFGESIRPVLDGEEEPNLDVYMVSRLDNVPIGVQVHLMDRNPTTGSCSSSVQQAEQRADRLALELLAPADLVRHELAKVSTTEGPRRLETLFGLPTSAARSYAVILRNRPPPPKFGIGDFLGEDGT